MLFIIQLTINLYFSRGAELIEELRIKESAQEAERERQILEKIKAKMDRIKATQQKILEAVQDPATHAIGNIFQTPNRVCVPFGGHLPRLLLFLSFPKRIAAIFVFRLRVHQYGNEVLACPTICNSNCCIVVSRSVKRLSVRSV